MSTLFSSIRSFIFLSIFSASQAAYQDTCSYVKIVTDFAATPMKQWGFAYPLDICMTYQLVAGQPTYQKYVCNDAGQIRLETWDTNTCDGALSASEDPATLGTTIEDFSCDTYGECDYMMMKYYPPATGDCDDTAVYKEEAIIADVCVTIPSQSISFKWSCDKTMTFDQEATMLCPNPTIDADASSGCVDSRTNFGVAFMGYWDVSSDGCLSITYAKPTTQPPSNNPTASPSALTSNPSTNPSESPTRNPSETPSRNPSESPSENPSESPSESPSRNPSQTPSESPTAEPTVEPSKKPSSQPSVSPSSYPSASPSSRPSSAPSFDDNVEEGKATDARVVMVSTIATCVIYLLL